MLVARAGNRRMLHGGKPAGTTERHGRHLEQHFPASLPDAGSGGGIEKRPTGRVPRAHFQALKRCLADRPEVDESPAMRIRRAMNQTPNFVPVLHHLAEPDLRLWICANMGREYESGQFEIVLEHDPEMRRDTLLRPLSPWLLAIWERTNRGKPPPASEPNRSVEAVKLASFGVTHTLEAGEVRLLMHHAHQNVARSAARLEQALNLSPGGSGFQLIVDTLKASVRLPTWDYQAQSEVRDRENRLIPGPPRRWVSLYLERALALELAASSDFSFDGDADYVLLARRELPR